MAAMEDVLDLYAEPYDPDRPVVCFDETSTQLLAEVREPLPPQPGRPRRQDYESGNVKAASNPRAAEPRQPLCPQQAEVGNHNGKPCHNRNPLFYCAATLVPEEHRILATGIIVQDQRPAIPL